LKKNENISLPHDRKKHVFSRFNMQDTTSATKKFIV
jgi:hypothetical protein